MQCRHIGNRDILLSIFNN